MSAELQARLAALRTAFIGRCAEDGPALAQAMQDGDRSAVKAIAHRLAGSGTLFGFPEVTKAAARLETAVDQGAELQADALLDLLRDAASAG